VLEVTSRVADTRALDSVCHYDCAVFTSRTGTPELPPLLRNYVAAKRRLFAAV